MPAIGLVQGFSASGADVWVENAHYFERGVVVSAVGARCGKTFLAEPPWTAIANTHALIPDDNVDARFLWYFTNREDWWEKSGSAQPFVKVKDTLNRQILLPPIEVQKEVVEVLDLYFSELDALLTFLESLRSLCEAFKRSLLHAAFEGTLMKTMKGESAYV